MNVTRNVLKRLFRQRGGATAEFLFAVPALLLLGLGGLQTLFFYDAKTTLTYATFESARVGAVTHAQRSKIRSELGVRLSPIFGGDGSASGALKAMAESTLEVHNPLFTRIEILNPTQEAFEDFGVKNQSNGKREIPNDNLRSRSRQIGAKSGVTLQDANILKVKVTYGYKLEVPLIRHVLPAIMKWVDPGNIVYYVAGRIPMTAVATVRMQSAAWPDNNAHAGEGSGGGTPPETTDPGEGSTPGGDADNGGDDSGAGDGGDDTGTGGDTGSGDGTAGGDNGSGGDTPPGDDLVDGGDSGTGEESGNGGTGDPGNGNPTCSSAEGEESTGTTTGLPAQSAGNPINVTNGNKYQREADLSGLSGGLPLYFVRHYNSHDPARGPQGVGWRHSYELSLRAGSESLELVQSDGRLLSFEVVEETDSGTRSRRYRGRLASDGEIVADAQGYLWRQPEGKRLRFDRDGRLQEILRRGQGLRLHYADDGRLQGVSDSQGRSLSLAYDAKGRLTALIDPAGRQTRYAYDARNNLERVTRPDGSARRYHYEDLRERHALTGITDERGVRYATWSYDAEGRAVSSRHAEGVEAVTLDYTTPGQTRVTDSQGRVSVYTLEQRDGLGHVLSIQGPGCSSCGGGDVRYRYNDRHQVVERTTREGISDRYRYDDLGRTTEIIRQMPGEAPRGLLSYRYEGENRRPAAVIRPSVNPQGKHRLEIRYNVRGLPIELTERGWRPEIDGGYRPIDRTTKIAYDDFGNIIQLDGPREDIVDKIQLSYDNLQRLSSIMLADGTTQRVLAYDAYGHPTKVQNGNQTPLTIRYNELGLPLEFRQGESNVVYNYDAVGKLTGITQPDGQILKFGYDTAGRVVSMVDEEGNSVRKLLDTEDRLLAYSIESSKNDVLRATMYLRDANHRLRGVVTPEGIQRMVGYDKSGRRSLDTNGGGKGSYIMRTKAGTLQTVMDASGGEIRKATMANGHIILTQDSLKRIDVIMRDDFGNRVVWRNPDSGLTYYRYDKADNLIEKRDSSGAVIRYEYDAENRLVRLENSDGITHIRYDSGLLVEAEGPDSKQSYGYNSEGRLIKHVREIDGHRFTTFYDYDARTGKLKTRQLPGGEQLAYRYEASQGRLSAVVKTSWLKDQPLLEGVTYEPFGRMTGYTHADGSRTEMAYDQSGRLIRQGHSRFGEYKLAYNVAGELSLVESDQGQSRYVYDAAGRLYEADTSTGQKQYRYDALANRRSPQPSPLKKVSIRTRTSGLSKEGKKDLLGRQTELGDRRWEYNAAGRPVRFYRGERLVAEYRYNHLGERIRKTIYFDDPNRGHKSTYYLYDLQRRLSAEADENGTVTRQYLYVGRRPYAMLEKDNIYNIQADHLGAPQIVTDDKNRLVWQAEYDPFGRAMIKTQGIDFNLRRPGQYEDVESGLYENYLRSYDPDNGRYLEPDPLGNLDGMNRYAYVGNRPLERTDPLGLFSVRMGVTSIDVPVAPLPGGGWQYASLADFGYGDTVHESILIAAFERFNESHPGAFSDHTIDLFVAANVRTDLIFDANHQFSGANHFDNPNDTSWNQESGPSTWIMDSINSIKSRRAGYSGDNIQAGCTLGGDPIYDISSLVEGFGSLSHTLADFYAHTNWVDPSSRGGKYYIQRETTDYGIFTESGYVPPGVGMNEIFDFDSMSDTELNDWMTKLYSGNAEGCSTLSCAVGGLMTGAFTWDGDLYPSAEASYYHNVKGGQDSNSRWDETTHAYWQKDSRGSVENTALFVKAAQLAVEHTVKEIERLWATTEGNAQLREIFAATEAQKAVMNVYYAERPLNPSEAPNCPFCPVFGSWKDELVDIANP